MAAVAVLLDLPLLQQADRPLPPLETAPQAPAHQTEPASTSDSTSTSSSVVYIASFAGTLGTFFLVGCLLVIRAHRRSQRIALNQHLSRRVESWAGLSSGGAPGAQSISGDWRFVAGHGRLPVPKLFEARIDSVLDGTLAPAEPTWTEAKVVSLTPGRLMEASRAR